MVLHPPKGQGPQEFNQLTNAALQQAGKLNDQQFRQEVEIISKQLVHSPGHAGRLYPPVVGASADAVRASVVRVGTAFCEANNTPTFYSALADRIYQVVNHLGGTRNNSNNFIALMDAAVESSEGKAGRLEGVFDGMGDVLKNISSVQIDKSLATTAMKKYLDEKTAGLLLREQDLAIAAMKQSSGRYSRLKSGHDYDKTLEALTKCPILRMAYATAELTGSDSKKLEEEVDGLIKVHGLKNRREGYAEYVNRREDVPAVQPLWDQSKPDYALHTFADALSLIAGEHFGQHEKRGPGSGWDTTKTNPVLYASTGDRTKGRLNLVAPFLATNVQTPEQFRELSLRLQQGDTFKYEDKLDEAAERLRKQGKQVRWK